MYLTYLLFLYMCRTLFGIYEYKTNDSVMMSHISVLNFYDVEIRYPVILNLTNPIVYS